LREDSAGTGFRVGNAVGEVARRLYDPKGKGALVDPKVEGYSAALQRSKSLLDSSQPIFEAGSRTFLFNSACTSCREPALWSTSTSSTYPEATHPDNSLKLS
jgi:hypothetical protein